MTNTYIITLTDIAQQSAQRILGLFPHYIHLHQPNNFATTVAGLYQEKQRLLMICASGIAIRTLCSVIDSKLTDPPVVLADEHANNIIPLLNVHQGGANAWAMRIATALNANVVFTNTEANWPRYIAGIGSIRHCQYESLISLLSETLHNYDLQLEQIHSLVSIDLKHDETAMLQLAKDLDVSIEFYSSEQLDTMESKVQNPSEIVRSETGSASVSEAAALFKAHQFQ
ncbi:MAG: cobalamin biosynthesis protein, partial [Gammaproteobacteria bacterium]|nr:cobalamin biosynthesis protein [Gammaproteobacteria bacterium]